MSELCKISPLFCPGAYPADLQPGNGSVPCWPDKGVAPTSRDTRLVNRPVSPPARPTTNATSSSSQGQASNAKIEQPTRGQHLLSRLFSRFFESR
jgi:hypothetical protein